MLLDKYISYNHKIFFSLIISGIWIYYRTSDCYVFIPRKHILPVIFVIFWNYLNYKDPLFLPIGLFILLLYRKLYYSDLFINFRISNKIIQPYSS